MCISYTRARAASLGTACEVGILERGLRTGVLLFWALVLGLWPGDAGLLWGGLAAYWILTLFTVLQRIFWVRESMAGKAGPPDPLA